MNDSNRPGEAAGLPKQTGYAPPQEGCAGGPEFVPLRLVLRPGSTAVELTRPDMLIGRHTDADIRLSLPDVSRRHCRLVYAASRWQIFDLNSLNGVFVNGDRVHQATLDEGDLIRIGGLTFQVELGEEKPASAVAGRTDAGARPGVLESIVEALPDGGHPSDPAHRKAS
jgi:pSer/pThr/pTyr-binding forkhead associated (FHA) protein